MSSLYAKYIKEREGKEIFETEWGFVSYKINGPEIYLADIFIDPRERGKENVRSLISKLVEEGLKNNCEILTANIHLAAYGANNALRVALHLGFELKAASNDVLYIVMNLKEDK